MENEAKSSSSFDEESFVILGDSLVPSLENQFGKSLIPERKQLLHEELENLNGYPVPAESVGTSRDSSLSQSKVLINMETSIPGALPDLPNSPDVKNTSISSVLQTVELTNSEEIQINQLIEENLQLKNTILQNNNSMKSQYEKILQWQKEVEEIHENHKQKFLKAKQMLETLKAENGALQQDVKRLSETSKEKTNNAIETRVAENMNQAELDLAKKKIASLESQLQKLTEAQGRESTKRIQYEGKLEMYEAELEKSYKTIREQKKELEEWQQKLEAVGASEKELSDKNSGLELKIAEIIMDKKALSDSISGLTYTLEEKTKALNECQQQIQTLLSEGRTNQHECQAEALRKQLLQSQKALTQSNEERTTVQRMFDNSLARITELEKTLVKYESYDDTIYALKTQIELYKNDFEVEKQAKEEAIRELRQLAKDQQNIHRRNTQLLEEIEYYRNRAGTLEEGPYRPSQTHDEVPESPPLTRYTCPVCNSLFRSLRLVEEHLETCISHQF